MCSAIRQDAALQGNRKPRLHEEHVLERHVSVPTSSHSGHYNGVTGHQRDAVINAITRTCDHRRSPSPSTTSSSSISLPSAVSRKEIFQLLSDAQRARIAATSITTKCELLDRLRTCDPLIRKLRSAATAVTAVPEGDKRSDRRAHWSLVVPP